MISAADQEHSELRNRLPIDTVVMDVVKLSIKLYLQILGLDAKAGPNNIEPRASYLMGEWSGTASAFPGVNVIVEPELRG